jgi:hypothetical protein
MGGGGGGKLNENDYIKNSSLEKIKNGISTIKNIINGLDVNKQKLIIIKLLLNKLLIY